MKMGEKTVYAGKFYLYFRKGIMMDVTGPMTVASNRLRLYPLKFLIPYIRRSSGSPFCKNGSDVLLPLAIKL